MEATVKKGLLELENIQSEITQELLKELIGYVDLTSLNSTDNQQTITSLANSARLFQEEHGYTVPAVCVYPNWVMHAKMEVPSNVEIACVATGFPEGQTFLEVKLAEVKMAVQAGASEIDMVINRGAFLAEKYNQVHDEIAQVKAICGKDVHLKVILEVCDLPNLEAVERASRIAIDAGADFIKTSTGKGKHGATPESFYVMCLAIKASDMKVGIKAAGGIRTIEDASLYRNIVWKVLGGSWLDSKLFRIGASSLVANIESALYPNQKQYF